MTTTQTLSISDLAVIRTASALEAVRREIPRFDLPSTSMIRMELLTAESMLEHGWTALTQGDGHRADHEMAVVALGHAGNALERAITSSKTTAGDRRALVPIVRGVARAMGLLDALI